jgi:hypothetical protein
LSGMAKSFVMMGRSGGSRAAPGRSPRRSSRSTPSFLCPPWDGASSSRASSSRPTTSRSPQPHGLAGSRSLGRSSSSRRREMGPGQGTAAPRCLLLAFLALGCGASSSNAPDGSTTAKPLLAGDTCGVYADQQSCVGAGCRFAINTRPCIVGQPCPAGWCFAPGPTQPPAGPVASCACEGSTGDVCVLQLGGPAVQVGSSPSLSCRRGCQFFAPATPDEICNCVAQAPVERCWPGPMVSNLCDCDSGVR